MVPSLRFALVKVALRLASLVAWFTRRRRPPAGLAEGDYQTTSIAQKFLLSGDWDAPTIAVLPPSERYPPLIKLAKSVVVAALAIPLENPGRWSTRAELGPLYRGLPLPHSMDSHWQGDQALAHRCLQGANPLWLTASDTEYVVDYQPILDGIPTVEGRFLAPCAAWFTLGDKGLRPTRIALRQPEGLITVTPDDGPAWSLAKMFFASADMFIHEVISHFLWTHMHGEAMLLATAQYLSSQHPIRQVLAPHFALTLQANENSGSRLLGEGGLFDRAFSAGWPGTVELLKRGEDAWSFDRLVPQRDLQARGVADLPDYPYAEDAVLVWNALQRYVQEAIHRSHADDAAVVADVELQRWAQALKERFPGWPDHNTVEGLVLATTAIAFTNVRHTLVNAQQYDAFGYPPACPATLHVPFPSDPHKVTEQTLVDALPNIEQTMDTIRATYSFSIQFTTLSAAGPHPDLAAAFHDELAAISATIANRNHHRSCPYTVAAPANISNSINA